MRLEQQRMQPGEQQPSRSPRRSRPRRRKRKKNTPHAAKKPWLPVGAITRQPIEHAAEQKHREDDVRGDDRRDHGRQRAGVGDGADVLEHRGEAENRGHECLAEPAGLREKLVPPVEVDAVAAGLAARLAPRCPASMPRSMSASGSASRTSSSHRPSDDPGRAAMLRVDQPVGPSAAD